MAQEVPTSPTCQVIILTALPIEFWAVVAYLQETQEIVHPQGTIYRVGSFVSNSGPLRVAVAQIGMGGVSAAAETERAIHFFRPHLSLFVGIAGGLKDVQLGDVVAATKVYAYESGKAGQTFEPRPEVWRTSYPLEQRARHEASKETWLARLNGSLPDPAPHAHVGALAAGEKVLASTQAAVYNHLQATYGDALAIEMEGHGFLEAVHVNHDMLGLVIRGISDLIDDKAAADAGGSQMRAARHAAAFAFQMLATFDSPSQVDKRRRFLIKAGTGVAATALAAGAVGAVIEFVRKAVLGLVSVSLVSEWWLPGKSFNDLEYSPDNSLLAAARGNNTAQIISASTGNQLVTYPGHTKFVNSISWAKDGQRVVTGSSDGTAQIWSAQDGTWLLTYEGHNGVVLCVAWSPDGATIASSSSDKTVQLWKPISDATTPVTFRGHESKVTWVAWSPDSKQLVSSDENGLVLIWNPSHGMQIGAPYTGHHGPVDSVRWSPDGTKIASAGQDALVRIWDARTHKDIAVCQGHTKNIYDLSWSADSTHLISGSEDHTFQMWKVGTPYPLAINQDPSAVHCSVYSRDGNQIATGDQGDGTIGKLRIWQENWIV